MAKGIIVSDNATGSQSRIPDGVSGSFLRTDGAGNQAFASIFASVGVSIDGAGAVITTGQKGFIIVPYDGVITEWDLIADASGSIVIDVWKTSYANAPPTVANTIADSQKPTLSSQQKNQLTNLSGWTTNVSAGDVIGFNVDSATTVTRVTLLLKIKRT